MPRRTPVQTDDQRHCCGGGDRGALSVDERVILLEGGFDARSRGVKGFRGREASREARGKVASLADMRVFQNQQRAVQAVQQSTRRRALNSWVATREARRRRTEALEGALMLWQICCCGRVWRTWRTVCADRATLAGALHCKVNFGHQRP